MFFGGEMGLRSIIQWFVFIGFFMIVMPKLYFYQIFSKLEQSAKKLEELSKKGASEVITKTSKYGRGKKEIKDVLGRFIDFFLIQPVNLDPFGILTKMEHMINNTEDRFKDVARQIAPKADSEKTMDVFMGLQAEVTIHMIAKIVRHFVETVKKYKNLQIAMIIQMQLPMIEKLVEAEHKGLKAFLAGKAIGDGAGPLVIASLVNKKGKEIASEVMGFTDKRWGRTVTFLKAKGPGGRLGKIGEGVRIVCTKNKIAKIITIDAAQKLEGEKTGTVAEGVGAAIGGAGVQRAKIEKVATEKGIPLDAIAIKMSPFEAISPMPEDVVNALGSAKEYMRRSIERTKNGSHILVVGVGNTCGVPNTNKDLNRVMNAIRREAKKVKKEEEAKNKGFFKRSTTNMFRPFAWLCFGRRL